MRKKDEVLKDIKINGTRIVIAKNRTNHIIRYAPANMNNFDKKAQRAQHSNLDSAIDWLKDKFDQDFSNLIQKNKQHPNRPYKANKYANRSTTSKSKDSKCKIGGNKQHHQLKIFK